MYTHYFCLILEKSDSWGTTRFNLIQISRDWWGTMLSPGSWVNEPWNDWEVAPLGTLCPPEMIPDGLQFQVRRCHTLMQPASLRLWEQPSHTVAEQPSLAVSFVPWITEILAFFFSSHHSRYYVKSASAVEFHILTYSGVPIVTTWDPCLSMSFSRTK